MALNNATLTTQIQTAFASGVTGADSDAIATAIAAAYDIYAKAAQSCAGLPPTVVNLPGLESGLKAAMADTSTTSDGAAGGWANAAEAYWTGALFGASGAVVLIPGTAGLKLELTGVFSSTANTAAGAASQISTALDKFTKLIQVKDALLPIPPGCGPSPII
jgi:hypothetical protein